MRHSLRIHRPSPRPCEHHAIVPQHGHPDYGRCLDCNATLLIRLFISHRKGI